VRHILVVPPLVEHPSENRSVADGKSNGGDYRNNSSHHRRSDAAAHYLTSRNIRSREL
jgi:hypothetical protein